MSFRTIRSLYEGRRRASHDMKVSMNTKCMNRINIHGNKCLEEKKNPLRLFVNSRFCRNNSSLCSIRSECFHFRHAAFKPSSRRCSFILGSRNRAVMRVAAADKIKCSPCRQNRDEFSVLTQTHTHTQREFSCCPALCGISMELETCESSEYVRVEDYCEQYLPEINVNTCSSSEVICCDCVYVFVCVVRAGAGVCRCIFIFHDPHSPGTSVHEMRCDKRMRKYIYFIFDTFSCPPRRDGTSIFYSIYATAAVARLGTMAWPHT